MSAAPQLIVTLTTDELASLVRQCVREELAERGYVAEQELLSKEQAGKLFGVTTRSITTWMTREALPYKKGHGGRIVFQRDELATWAKEHGYAIRGKVA